MTRREEFDALALETRQTPPGLADSVRRAVRRARLRRFVMKPLAAAACFAVSFAALVNVSLPFALAAHDVPVVRELVEMLAVSPSLKEALDHDFVQYLGYTAKDNGITFTLEYMIADQTNLTVFYRLNGTEKYTEGKQPYDVLDLSFDLTDENGGELEYASVWNHPDEEGGRLRRLSANFMDVIPAEMRLTLRLSVNEDAPDAAEAESPQAESVVGEIDVWFDQERPEFTPLAEAAFPIRVDERLSAAARTIELGQTYDVLGQKLIIDRVELYPTLTRVYWHEDPANDRYILRAPLYLMDAAGEPLLTFSDSGLSGFGAAGDESRCAVLQSIYFDTDQPFYLCLDSVMTVPKDRLHVYYDPENGFTETPEGVTASVERDGERLVLKFDFSAAYDAYCTFSSQAFRADGSEYHSVGYGSMFGETRQEYLAIDDYDGGRVTLCVQNAPREELREPIRLQIQ